MDLMVLCLTGQLALSNVATRPAAAAGPAGVVSTTSSELAAVREMIESLQEQLDGQRELLARHEQQIEAQRRTIDLLRGRLAEGSEQAAAAQAQPGDEATVQPPELPQSFVGRGEFPGSIEIPGTGSSFKVGGEARFTLVHSLGPLGVDDRFISSSIPVDNVRAGDEARTTYIAGPSRVNLEVRMPSTFGGLRTFVEYDFMGEGSTAKLRHAFIQAGRWMFGQTWSTFSDPEAQPADIDFEGLNAISLFRQAQIRYTQPVSSQVSLAVSIENPAPDLTGAAGVNLTPDFVARLRWEPGDPGRDRLTRLSHVQAAVLGRALRGELADAAGTTLSTGGFGVDVSGVMVPRFDPSGRIKFATTNGWGIGRYIKDLEANGGQDAVYDPANGQLRALGVTSGYVGYERQWFPRWQSAITYGLVRVDNLDIQTEDALKRTQRSSLSVTFNPVPRADIVIEYLLGERVNKNGDRGRSSQIQGGWKFRF